MMKYLHNLLRAAVFGGFFIAGGALAQNAGTVTSHAFAIGKGAGSTGYTSLLCTSAQLAVGQAAADPICRTITGDVTLSAAGATTLATVNANVGSFGSATNCTTFTVNAKGLITAASQTACTPAVGSISGLGSGVATWLATPSSANLRAAVTDETGTGLLYFQGGALGTPASGTLTNATGLPIGTGVSGLGTGVATALAAATNSAGGVVTSPVANANLATMAANTFKANGTAGTAAPTDIACAASGVVGRNASGNLNCQLILDNNIFSGAAIATSKIAFGTGGATAAAAAVNTSGGFVTQPVANASLANAATTVAGQTCTLGAACGLGTASNTLASPVLLNNTANYFTGPSMAQGTTGTWFVSGTVTLFETAAAIFQCKLWDGTTVIANSWANVTASGTGTISLSGIITSPAGNMRISCRDQTTVNGQISATFGDGGKDSTIWGIRIN